MGNSPEFGSEYHSFAKEYFTGRASLQSIYPSATLTADGRQPLMALVRQEGWKRLWVPEYFCYDVLDSIRKHTQVKIMPYRDFPERDVVEKLPFKDGDAVLRMNYFGLRKREWMELNEGIPVIEDHSHDVLSRWAQFSDADWCIASLRKTLPIAEGGMVWSPKGRNIVWPKGVTAENAALAEERWMAMDKKAEYLQGRAAGKEEFRRLFALTEERFDSLELSGMDDRSAMVVRTLDIEMWYGAKKRNWKVLTENLAGGVEYLRPEDESCTPFSMVLKFRSEREREEARKAMVAEAVYPAVLWRVPETCNPEVRELSERLLSVHCDGRYNVEGMVILAGRINSIIEKL